MNKQPQVLQIVAAGGAWIAGVMVYVFDRNPDSVYFLLDQYSFFGDENSILGNVGNYLPAFIHVYVFILLTVIVAGPTFTRFTAVCATWFAIDTLFEIGQTDPFAQWIVRYLPGWFDGIPFLENTRAYFLAGTFDVLDLVSIFAGTVSAYLTIHISQSGRNLYVPD